MRRIFLSKSSQSSGGSVSYAMNAGYGSSLSILSKIFIIDKLQELNLKEFSWSAGFGGALVDMDVNVETINADVETITLDLVALLERTNTCARIESGNVTMPEPNLPAIEELRNTSIDNLESDMYFYHSDHLGSSSWITDASGAVNQHLQYLPLRQAHFDKLNAPQGGAFGESFVFQNSSSWQSPYTFSGKEKDSEIERSGDSRTPLKNKQKSE